MTLFLALLLAQTDLLHISDTHTAQLDGVRPELAQLRALHRDSQGKLERFVDLANTMPALTVVHTGDIVDATCFDGAGPRDVGGQIEPVRQALARLRHPFHLALGNHDVECYRFDPAKPKSPVGDQSIAKRARREWGRNFPALRKRTYYSTPLAPGYRLYVLDNGHSLEAKGGQSFFAGQLKWLGRELRRHPRERAIIALHIPVAGDPKSNALKAVLRHSPAVALILCGHRHTHAVDWLTLGPRKVLQVRTGALYNGPDSWRRIRLHPDRLEVFAPGANAQPVETLHLPAP